MRRAKKPPPAALVGEASVLADIIAVGRLDDGSMDEEEHAALVVRIDEIAQLAIAEYLRLFPRTRNVNNRTWIDTLVRIGNRYTNERDFQCFFCRKSLNTYPARRSFTRPLERHTTECGVRMIAGLLKPHKPLKNGETGL